MAKPCWFPFYPGDFLSSSKVALMTTEEIGAYVLLLCHQWQDPLCSLQNDDEILKKLSRFSGNLEAVKGCFTLKQGRLINKRMYGEWVKSKRIRQLKKKAGVIGMMSRWSNSAITSVITEGITKHNQSQSQSQSQSQEDKEKKEKTPLPPTGGVVCVVDEFERFWESYPKKVGKAAARRVWVKLKDRPPLDDLLAALARARQTEQWKKDGGQFIPHPATWLNQGRWEDEPVETLGSSDPNGFLAGLNAFITRGASS